MLRVSCVASSTRLLVQFLFDPAPTGPLLAGAGSTGGDWSRRGGGGDSHRLPPPPHGQLASVSIFAYAAGVWPARLRCGRTVLYLISHSSMTCLNPPGPSGRSRARTARRSIVPLKRPVYPRSARAGLGDEHATNALLAQPVQQRRRCALRSRCRRGSAHRFAITLRIEQCLPEWDWTLWRRCCAPRESPKPRG